MSLEKFCPFNETILDTIEWGKTYRYERDQLQRASILPTVSKLNMHYLWEQYQRSKQLAEIKELRRKLSIKPQTQKILKLRIDPDVVSKKEYYDYMSTPRQINRPISPPPPISKSLLKKSKEPCTTTPQIEKLALPNKIQVLQTWKDHANSLPMDTILRLEDLLKDKNQNLVPRFASCYYKSLDKRKRKKNRKIKKKCRKKQKLKEEHEEWLTTQTEITSDLLIRFLEEDTIPAVNFKQMMLSEAILNELHREGDLEKRPSRNTKNPFGRSLVDIVDQMSVWIDTIVRYVDAQDTESSLEMENLSQEFEEEDMDDEAEEEEPSRQLNEGRMIEYNTVLEYHQEEMLEDIL